MNAFGWFQTFVQDLRYGLRELQRHPGFAITAVLSLALGIMAATAMYSVIHGVIVDPFPYKDVDDLASIFIRNQEQTGARGGYSIEEFDEVSRRSKVFSGVAASTISDVLWMNNGEPQRLRGNHISNNGFDVMGVPAMLGRTVSGSEEAPETKVVLGYRFWVNKLAANTGVIGTTLVLNGRPRVVVGVMPPRFMFRGADVYVPIRYRTGELAEGVDSLWITARLKSGIQAAALEADLDPIFRDLAARNPTRFPKKWRVEMVSFKETFPSGIREVLWIMFGAVGLLLLIACANVSNLMLARSSAREREISVRAALGAGRGRLFRQLLTESLVLGLLGGLLGVGLSWLGLRAILAIVPPNVIPDESEVTLNLPVLAFSFLACLITTLIAGFAPALHAASGDLAKTMKEAGRGSGGSRSMSWLRGGLVIVELSLAVILLAGAGLFLHTFIRLRTAPLAVGVDNRLVMRLPLNAERYPTVERRSAFIREALDHIGALPGVLGVGINAGLHPLGSWTAPVQIVGIPDADPRPVNIHQINAAYLKATGIKLLSGRAIEDADVGARRHLAVVNQTFAERYFAGQRALGKVLRVPRLRRPPIALEDDSFEIVGVAADAIHELQTGESRPEFYIPYSITGLANTLVVHTAGDPLRMAPYVRAQIYALDHSQFVDESRTLEDLIDRDVYSRGRFQLWLMGLFGTVGLTLSVIGVYGLVSQIVALQRREFGVRLAIGASYWHILRSVLTRGLRLIMAGLIIGLITALLLLRRYGLQLGVTDPFNLASISGACGVLLAAGVAACIVPAVRAARTNPVSAIRLE